MCVCVCVSQNHAEELKKVCLDYISRNLAAVMTTDGYRYVCVCVCMCVCCA